jgi:hypothetical protein
LEENDSEAVRNHPSHQETCPMTEKKSLSSLARASRAASILCLTLVMPAGVAMAQGDGKDTGKDKGKDKHSVPEINVGSMAGGVALLSGGLLILAEKFKSKKDPDRGER